MTSAVQGAFRARSGWAWLFGAVLVFAVPGCLVKDDERCGTAQVFDPATDLCTCAPGFVATKAGCEMAAPTLGASCAPGSMPCTDAVYNHCVVPADGKGYCTKKSCTKHEDCGGGYTCASWEAEPYCKRPPTGVNKACSTMADCAGNEAAQCETFMLKSCQVSGCTRSPDNCQAGTRCCEIPFGDPKPTLCLAQCPF